MVSLSPHSFIATSAPLVATQLSNSVQPARKLGVYSYSTCRFFKAGDLKNRKDALEILRPLLRRYVMKSNLAPLRIFPKKT